MFNLGVWEIVVIGLIALIVVGPEKLPELARNVGRFINEVKRTTNAFTQEFTVEEKKFSQNKKENDEYLNKVVQEDENPPIADNDFDSDTHSEFYEDEDIQDQLVEESDKKS